MVWGAEEGAHVVGDPGGSPARARPGRDESGELGVCYPDAGAEVGGNRVQQRGDRSRFAVIQPFQPIQSGVGRAEISLLYAVGDPLQSGENAAEDLTIKRLVGI